MIGDDSFCQNWAAGEPNDYLGFEGPWGQFFYNRVRNINLGRWNDAAHDELPALIEIKLEEQPNQSLDSLMAPARSI